MKKNRKPIDRRFTETRLAGGFGKRAAKQSPEQALRRCVMSCLLWENIAYQDGNLVVDDIANLIPLVAPEIVFDIAVKARTEQKLRHVPLLIAREMARIDSHKGLVGKLLPRIILRADEITEFVALYWLDGKQPISKQVKVGLAAAFDNFDEYQFAKYNRKSQIKLRDVMFMVHPKPAQGKEELYKKLADNKLSVPDTWEVALSSGADKKATWERLIKNRKLGALAFLRNLRNMEDFRVDRNVIREGFNNISPKWLLPLNYFGAAKFSPRYEKEIEDLMIRGMSTFPKISGKTLLVVDVSGSMHSKVSSRSIFSRLNAACAMAVMAREMCEDITIYATAGDDMAKKHATTLLPARRGFALADAILESKKVIGGGGIFTRQCLEYIRKQEQDTPDRIIVFSDSQDCDYTEKRVPNPFGNYNYIIDISSHRHGINYNGVWTAEIAGWSEQFLNYIHYYENN